MATAKEALGISLEAHNLGGWLKFNSLIKIIADGLGWITLRIGLRE